MSTLNLDQKAAQYAQQIVTNAKNVSGVTKPMETLDRLATKTLGVLQEQGVYAMMLFLLSRSSEETKIAPELRQALYQLLQQLPQYQSVQELTNFKEDTETELLLQFYANQVCHELDTLLLVKELYEQALIYARYGAKAEGK